jgi:hypothetical protein
MQGILSEANSSFLEALQRAMELNLPPLALEVIVGLARVRYQEGNARAALELAKFALDHPAIYHEAAQRAERLCSDVKKQLDIKQIQSAESRAEEMTFASIIAELGMNPSL